MTAQHDDLLGAEAAGGNHTAQAHRAIANDCHRLAGAYPGGNGGMMARAHHV
jgi:hypothetical protein